MGQKNTIDKLYHFYRDECIQLARSIILKSNINAELVNKGLLIQYGIPASNNPRDWRYYKHLNGEYFVELGLVTREPIDKMMYVKSLDTLEEIAFTKENLNIHRATWRGYQIGSDYYNRLVERYPEQETLIKGILNPIDVEKAIDAKEYKILYYNELLVQPNEYFLIEELEEEIALFLERWDVRFFRITDEYYEPVRYAILYAYLPQLIMNIRLKYANTIFAHQFHIWNYLGSKGKLDEFKPYLTLEQSLWFYRNINWVYGNLGKADTFDDLVENIMSVRNLPLSKYIMKKDVSKAIEAKYSVDFIRHQLNLPHLDYDTNEDIRKLDWVMDKELPTALDNLEFKDIIHPVAKENMEYALHTNQETKVLESHVIDYTNEEIYKLVETLFNQWVWMSHHNRYDSIITVNNPRNSELMTMDVKDALIVFWYCLEKICNLDKEPDLIPSIMARNIVEPLVTNEKWNQILSMIDSKYDVSLYIRYIKEIYPTIGQIRSTEEFFYTSLRINQFLSKLYYLRAYEEDYYLRGEIDTIVKNLMTDYWLPLYPDESYTYHHLFRDRGWSIQRLTREDYTTLATQLFTRVTGSDFIKKTSVVEVQSAMVKLIDKLTSYSVHFIKTVNAQDVVILDTPLSKYGRYVRRYENQFRLSNKLPRILNAGLKTRTTVEMNIAPFKSDRNRIEKTESFYREFTTIVEVSYNGNLTSKVIVSKPISPIHNVRISNDIDEVDDTITWSYNGSLYTTKTVYDKVRDIGEDIVVMGSLTETGLERESYVPPVKHKGPHYRPVHVDKTLMDSHTWGNRGEIIQRPSTDRVWDVSINYELIKKLGLIPDENYDPHNDLPKP